MARLNIKVELGRNRVLGPGKIRLLELIAEEGSIRGAAKAMGMSYRRAWLLLHEVEAIMGAPVLAAATGGAMGGGTSLTDTGRAVIDRYRAIEAHASQSAGSDLRALSRMAKPESHRTPASLKKKKSTKTRRKKT